MGNGTLSIGAVLVVASARVLAIGSTGSAPNDVTLQIRSGRPVVDGVYVNGHGPYRFLLDTGSTLNHLEPRLAQSIGLKATFDTVLRSATGMIRASGTDGIEVTMQSVTASGQTVLFAGLDAVHHLAPDIRGILGQDFLSQFNYLVDLRKHRLAFGKLELDGTGTRVPFRIVDGRQVVTTSLGSLVLDSGADLMVRFGVEPTDAMQEMRTMSGSVQVGTVWSTLFIDGRRFWRGEAVALPHSEEAGVGGLLPMALFNTVYVCN